MINNQLLLSSLIVAVLLGGCTAEFGQKEIQQFCKDEYGLTHLKISDRPEIVTGSDEIEDGLWTVTLKNDPGFRFHVKDDHYWGMETPANRLVSDYEDVMLIHLMAETEQPETLYLQQTTEENLTVSHLQGHYRNLDELNDILTEAMKLKTLFQNKGYTVEDSLDTLLILDNPVNDRFPLLDVNGSRFHFRITSMDNNTIDKALYQAVECCLGYGFKEPLENVDPDLIRKVMSTSSHRLSIIKDEETTVALDNVLACTLNQISFPALYEILLQEGFEMTGNAAHYTFTTQEGKQIEICNDFTDGGSLDHPLYYHLEDGERVDHEFNHEISFAVSKIEEMCGISLKIGE